MEWLTMVSTGATELYKLKVLYKFSETPRK